MKRIEFEKYLNDLLKPQEFEDYGPNGLQVEGKDQIKKVGFSVSATQESVQLAIKNNVDALIVHHGLFWKFHKIRPVIGAYKKRLAPLIKNDINLFGYHLPLDAHLEVGNAANLAKNLLLEDIRPFGKENNQYLGAKGNKKFTSNELQKELSRILNKEVLCSTPNENISFNSIGIITGGARDQWQLCLNEGVDAYITGEMSEHHWHEAKESGIHMFAGGHHATEEFGVKALMDKIKKDLSLEVEYFPSNNPA